MNRTRAKKLRRIAMGFLVENRLPLKFHSRLYRRLKRHWNRTGEVLDPRTIDFRRW